MNTSLACSHLPTRFDASDYNAYLQAIGKVFFHVYASSATHLFEAEELRQLMQTSRRNNAALSVSGMLLYKDGNILQVLEGREESVRALAAKIHGDPRHHGVITLVEGFENEYQFPDWSMGFRDLHGAEAKGTPGYSAFLDTAFNPKALAADPTVAQRLLLTFRQIM